MATLSNELFDRKARDAKSVAAGYALPMINQQMTGREWLTLLILAVIWGGAFMFIGVAVHHVHPLTYVWLRLTIAAGGMFLFLKLKGERLNLRREVWGSILLLALLNNALPFTLFGWGQTHIASGLASILNATTPIWGVLVAHFFTADERMTPRKIAGVLLGFAGVATMIGPMLLTNIGTDALAQLACIVAALCYAFAAVWARRFRRMGIAPMSVTTGQLTAGALMMLPLALLIDQPWTQPLPPLTAWGAIVALALLCTAFGYVLYFRLIAHIGPANAIAVTFLIPVFAVVWGWIFLDEGLTLTMLFGCAVILVGTGLATGVLKPPARTSPVGG